jgi:uncharacterized protein YhfF
MTTTRDIAALKARYPGAETFTFGDSRELSDRLVSLIRAGKKRATCGALRVVTEDGEALPSPVSLLRCPNTPRGSGGVKPPALP